MVYMKGWSTDPFHFCSILWFTWGGWEGCTNKDMCCVSGEPTFECFGGGGVPASGTLAVAIGEGGDHSQSKGECGGLVQQLSTVHSCPLSMQGSGRKGEQQQPGWWGTSRIPL